MNDRSTSNVLVHRNGDPTSPSFWEQFVPKDDEARANFARALADVVGETDVTAIRRRDIPSQRAWAGSISSRPNRRRKSR